MNEQKSRIALARIICIVAFGIAILLIVGIAGYSEMQRISGNFTQYFGDGGLFSEQIIFPILLIIATLPIPFIGTSAGLYAVNNSEREDQDKLLIGTFVGNIVIFLPAFLLAAYILLLLLNQI